MRPTGAHNGAKQMEDTMGSDLLGGLLTFAVGGLLAYGNFCLTKRMLQKKDGASGVGAVSILRQVINVAYLVLVYFLAPKLPCGMIALLVGAVLGLTIPMFLFTLRLAKLTKPAGGEAQTEDSKGGEN